jgi:hypothetical protein
MKLLSVFLFAIICKINAEKCDQSDVEKWHVCLGLCCSMWIPILIPACGICQAAATKEGYYGCVNRNTERSELRKRDINEKDLCLTQEAFYESLMNNNSLVTLQSFKTSISERYGQFISRFDISRAFYELDQNLDGILSYDEYLSAKKF